MIIEISAKFECDDCGDIFYARLDPAYTPARCLSVFALAEDAIRSDQFSTGCVIDERHLCKACVIEKEADQPAEGA